MFVLCDKADGNMKLGAEEDSIVAANSDQHVDRPLRDVDDHSAVNFNDEWERDVDELVSWTNTLDI